MRRGQINGNWLKMVSLTTVLSAGLLGSLVSEEGEDLILEHAERMNRRVENDRVILYLVEDVVWKRGDTVISSDAATYFEDDKWLRLTSNVKVTEPERIIHSDTVDYYEENDVAIATGQVKVISDDGDQEMRTTRLVYDRTADRMTAFNRPVVTITREEDDTADTSTLVIQGDHLISSAGDSLFVMGNVTVDGDSLNAECDSAFYDQINDWIRMRKNPVVCVNEYTIWGDDVDMFTPDDKLESAVVRGNAIAEGSKELKEDEKITGEERYWSSADSLVLMFEEEKLKSLSAYSNARSLLERENLERKIEKNYLTGESVVVEIKDGKAEKVTVEGSGKGVYVMPPDSAGTGAQNVRE